MPSRLDGDHAEHLVRRPVARLVVEARATELLGDEGRSIVQAEDLLLLGQMVIQCPLTVVEDRAQRARHHLLEPEGQDAVNRAGLDIELERLAGTSTRSVSLLFLDLDGFKGINDRYGHAAGDRLLVEIGARLRAVAGEQVVARLGGDEFVIVLPDAGAQMAEVMAAAVREAITRPIHLREHGALVSVGVSLGCASGSLAVDGAARLLADADAALYAAKRRRHRQAARQATSRNAA